ncbi:MAG: 6-bladed beta-propeller [Candidatus Aminicenantes bacterium]|nr:6-bladed beta-propeller [Candidatus Aminicenantes bacterium]
MKSTKKIAVFLSPWFWLFVLGLGARDVSPPTAPRFRTVDIKGDFATDERAMFARPVHLAFMSGRLTVVDAEDATVSIFDARGNFAVQVGGRGQGPGQLDFPTAAWAGAGGVLVSDGRHRRIVRFDARGQERDVFRLAFFPEAILPLAGDRVLVARNPGVLDKTSRILNCYDREGRPLWGALPPAVSGDRVADTMSNVVILLGGSGDDIFVVFRYRAAGIRRFSPDGRDLGEIRLARGYPVQRIKKTVGTGKTFEADVFCWHASYWGGRFYLLAADWTEERDLGPGSEVTIAGTDGRVQGVIDLPGKMTKIAASPDGLYAIDLDYRLRVLKVEKK